MHIDVPDLPKMYLNYISREELLVQPIFVSIYPGCIPTFGVMMDDGGVYADIPPSHLSMQSKANACKLRFVAYKNSPSSDVWGGKIASLKGNVNVFGRERDFIGNGKYLFTLDWPNDNWMVHMIMMSNEGGRLIFWPNFRLLWGEQKFPITLLADRSKITREWKL